MAPINYVKKKLDKEKWSNYENAAYARKDSIKQLPLNPDPNVLHQFASYNTLFTLSALSSTEIRNPKQFFQGKPHDIIAQSGGIGPDANRNDKPAFEQENQFTDETKKTIIKNQGLRDALGRATTEFMKNNDLYFRNVEMTSVPGYNEKRRLTSVTNIKMELVEPAGITLLEKIKAAAANNGYLDHLDAPYMLTVEFKGFDENGKQIKENNDYVKRVIPIKIMTMDIDVNQAGSYYTIQAIPYNEFGFTNVYMYPRTSGTLSSTTKNFKDAVVDLQRILNEQNQDEKVRQYNQFPDQYDISISQDLDPDTQLSFDLLSQVGMSETRTLQEPGSDAFKLDYLKFSSETSILKLLEDLMRTHPKYGAKSFEEWSEAVSKRGTDRFNPNEGLSTYFKYFRIRTSIEPTPNFDEIRQTNAKIIRVVVEPYYISAYNLATAGVHQDKNFQTYVAKDYNYIFTGDNLDIQNLDINYKVAYYQSRLKDLEASESRTFTSDNTAQSEDTGTPTNRQKWGPFDYLPTKTETGLYKTSNSGRTAKSDARVDQFFDAITNPTADMVVIRMDILGDPAWLGQSQFIPPTPVNRNGSSVDNNIEFFRGGEKDNIWNPTLRCFNMDVAEPVINLTFKTPQDLNDQTGVYELSSERQAVFSGLYKVFQVQHNFTDGKFTQTLTMTRFNNQDRKVTQTSNEKIVKKNGVITSVGSHAAFGNAWQRVIDKKIINDPNGLS
jgi:hypothetical protein